jgi:hypothetical protein
VVTVGVGNIMVYDTVESGLIYQRLPLVESTVDTVSMVCALN